MKNLSVILLVVVFGFLVMGTNSGWAEDKDKTGPGDKPAESKETKEKKASMDDDLDDLNNQLKPDRDELKDVDIMGTLNKIIEKMNDAEDALSTASTWKALTPQDEASKEIEKIIKRQKEALEQLNKIFKETGGSQSEAIKEIEKLIKIARAQQKQGEGSGSQPQPQTKPGQKPKPQGDKQPQPKQSSNPQKPGNPATKPYEATGTLPPGLKPFTGDPSKRWGNLPPKLRDEILELKQDELISEYLERLEKYFKILAGEEK